MSIRGRECREYQSLKYQKQNLFVHVGTRKRGDFNLVRAGVWECKYMGQNGQALDFRLHGIRRQSRVFKEGICMTWEFLLLLRVSFTSFLPVLEIIIPPFFNTPLFLLLSNTHA